MRASGIRCPSSACRVLTASARWEMKPLPSSISLRLQSRPTGRYSPSALRATGTAPTRAFLPLPATPTLLISVCWQRTASSPRLSCPRPSRWVPSITVRSTSSGPWCSIKRLTVCWLPLPRPMRLSVKPRAAGSRIMPSSWPSRPSGAGRSRRLARRPAHPEACGPRRRQRAAGRRGGLLQGRAVLLLHPVERPQDLR